MDDGHNFPSSRNPRIIGLAWSFSPTICLALLGSMICLQSSKRRRVPDAAEAWDMKLRVRVRSLVLVLRNLILTRQKLKVKSSVLTKMTNARGGMNRGRRSIRWGITTTTEMRTQFWFLESTHQSRVNCSEAYQSGCDLMLWYCIYTGIEKGEVSINRAGVAPNWSNLGMLDWKKMFLDEPQQLRWWKFLSLQLDLRLTTLKWLFFSIGLLLLAYEACG